MLSARVRLVLLWVSQVARVLADWGLRITVLLKLRDLGNLNHDAAWHQVTAVFFTPFVVLAPLHGYLSNAFPRHWVLMAASAFCLAAYVAFLPSGPWLACLGLVAAGSALYSPARYAMLPAAAHDAHLPLNSVNGWMEMGMAAAIIGGVILGLQVGGDFSPGLPWILVLLLILNVACLAGALPVRFPSDGIRPEPLRRALRGFLRDTQRIFSEPRSSGSLLGMAVFQGVVTAGSGAIFTLALNNAATGHTDAMYALILVCAGVALGCLLAGFQTNPRRSLGLVPYALTGLLVADVWAAAANVNGIAPAAPSLLLGIMGGVALVPMRTTYLATVPADARGNAMSVMNTFICLVTAAIAMLMWGLIHVGLLPTAVAQMWFIVVVVAAGAALSWWLLLPQALEQLAEWLIWPMYRIRAHGPGADQLPEQGPLLLIANHTSYFDPFWVAKVTPRRLTPMMTSDFYDLPVIRWLMAKVVRAIRVPRTTFRREAPELVEAAEVLRQGGCVLLFPESILRRKEEVLLRPFGRGAWHILHQLPKTRVAVLWIEGGWGSFASYKGGRPMKGKWFDWWRHIDIVITEPRPLAPEILADHRATRRYLRQVCLEARGLLGLPLPAETPAAEEPVEEDELGAPP